MMVIVSCFASCRTLCTFVRPQNVVSFFLSSVIECIRSMFYSPSNNSDRKQTHSFFLCLETDWTSAKYKLCPHPDEAVIIEGHVERGRWKKRRCVLSFVTKEKCPLFHPKMLFRSLLCRLDRPFSSLEVACCMASRDLHGFTQTRLCINNSRHFVAF